MTSIEAKTYIRSKLNKAVELLLSDIDGHGLFANTDLEKNVFIQVTHVHKDLANLKDSENTWINLTPNCLYNHSKKNENCEIITDGLTKGIITITDIGRGDELLVDYTKDIDLEQPEDDWQ